MLENVRRPIGRINQVDTLVGTRGSNCSNLREHRVSGRWFRCPSCAMRFRQLCPIKRIPKTHSGLSNIPASNCRKVWCPPFGVCLTQTTIAPNAVCGNELVYQIVNSTTGFFKCPESEITFVLRMNTNAVTLTNISVGRLTLCRSQ